MVKYKNICPICFIEKGYSIELKEDEKGIFHCPENSSHRFKKDKNGFWKKVE